MDAGPLGSQPVPWSRQYCSVDGAIVGVVAAVGAGPRRPNDSHFVERDIERECESLPQEVRLLRATPADDVAVLDFDQCASRAHTGMRLERPFVLRFDHPGGDLE